jgi:hypothetical protein
MWILIAGCYKVTSGEIQLELEASHIFLHAIALVKSEQGNTATEFTSLLIPWLSAMTNNLGSLAQQIDKGDYTSQGSSLAMQKSDGKCGEEWAWRCQSFGIN